MKRPPLHRYYKESHPRPNKETEPCFVRLKSRNVNADRRDNRRNQRDGACVVDPNRQHSIDCEEILYVLGGGEPKLGFEISREGHGLSALRAWNPISALIIGMFDWRLTVLAGGYRHDVALSSLPSHDGRQQRRSDQSLHGRAPLKS